MKIVTPLKDANRLGAADAGQNRQTVSLNSLHQEVEYTTGRIHAFAWLFAFGPSDP